MDLSRSNESSFKFNSYPDTHKVYGDISSKDRSARGNGIPISVRYKKPCNGELSVQRDHHRSDRLQQTSREPPSIELGTKRLKVRGPSFLGLESRLS